MTIAEFLEARISEDSDAACLATPEVSWVRWKDQENIPGWDGFIVIGDDAAVGEECNPTARVYIEPDATHILRHDPARVLAECEAKRLLIADLSTERHEVMEDCFYTCAAATEERDGGECCDDDRRGGACDCGRDVRVMRRLMILASPYIDHPDFEAEWTSYAT